MSEKFFPTFRYSPEVPQGRKFTDEAEFNALGPEWVDTPAKLVPSEAEKTGENQENPGNRGRRGRTPKEAA